MAELLRTTKKGNLLIENLEVLGIGVNLKDTSEPTTQQFRVEFERKNGTKLSFRLYKEEVEFLKHEINKW